MTWRFIRQNATLPVLGQTLSPRCLYDVELPSRPAAPLSDAASQDQGPIETQEGRDLQAWVQYHLT